MAENERVHFKIALPVDLKQRLEHAAVENRRSVSAEIISRVERSFLLDDPEGQFAKMVARLEELEAEAFERDRAVRRGFGGLGATSETPKGVLQSVLELSPDELSKIVAEAVGDKMREYGFPPLEESSGADDETGSTPK